MAILRTLFPALLAFAKASDVGYVLVDEYATKKLADGPHNSSLYGLDADAVGNGTLFLLDVRGATRQEMGYDQGARPRRFLLASRRASFLTNAAPRRSS